MPGLTLAITLPELQLAVAQHQGFSLDPTKWNARQLYVIEQSVRSGVSRVYRPKPIDGREVSVEWSFLRPQTEMFLASGTSQIRLPAEFGSFVGQITVVATTASARPWPVEWVNADKLRQMQQTMPQTVGSPRFASEGVARGPDMVDGQHKLLNIFPVADADYTLQCQWNINANMITGANPQCYGGDQYRELFKESCLACAEQEFDNEAGLHSALFNQQLMAAISADNRNKPQKLGYNANRPREVFARHAYPGPATYNGQSMSD